MILVAGATGTVGTQTVMQLIAAGARVRALVRDSAKAKPLEAMGAELAVGDLAEPTTLEAPFRGVEKAFLIPPVDERAVQMHDHFVQAAKRAGTRHIVKLSVLGADFDSPVLFLRWHAQGRRIIEDSGLPFTELQPNSFMQNLLRSAHAIATDGSFAQPGNGARISHVDARDIAAVAVQTLTEAGHEDKTYCLTGPEALSFEEIALTLSAVLKKPVRYHNLSPLDFKKMLIAYGTREWVADALNALHAFYFQGKGEVVTHTVCEVAKRPPTPFEQFARDHAAAFGGAA